MKSYFNGHVKFNEMLYLINRGKLLNRENKRTKITKRQRFGQAILVSLPNWHLVLWPTFLIIVWPSLTIPYNWGLKTVRPDLAEFEKHLAILKCLYSICQNLNMLWQNFNVVNGQILNKYTSHLVTLFEDAKNLLRRGPASTNLQDRRTEFLLKQQQQLLQLVPESCLNIFSFIKKISK